MRFLRINLLFIISILCACSFAYANDLTLAQTFQSQTNRYKISYPADWISEDKGKGVVVFKPKSEKSPNTYYVDIQTIYTKKADGKYATVKDIMDDLKTQVPRHLNNSNFIERGPITLHQSGGTKLSGEYAIFTYKANDIELKQWQIILMSKDGILFQAWAFTSPAQNYDARLPLAKAMLGSWNIT